jgi:hypothetical protein
MDAMALRFDQHNLPGPHILSVGPRVSLEITRGRVQERVRPIRGRVFLIGAASDCDLVLGDLQFPDAYAYVFVTGHEVTIRRLGAGPPLAVCGEFVESAELFHGDLIAFGPFELRLRIEEPSNSRNGGRDPVPGCRSLSEDDDSDDAIDEVRMLLADIRRALADEPAWSVESHASHSIHSSRACA